LAPSDGSVIPSVRTYAPELHYVAARKHTTFPRRPDLEIEDGLARLVHRQEVLGAVLDPGHRALEAQGGQGTRMRMDQWRRPPPPARRRNGLGSRSRRRDELRRAEDCPNVFVLEASTV
jgi:hypothetical protein